MIEILGLKGVDSFEVKKGYWCREDEDLTPW
jgi:hypothetical protein